MSPQTNAIDAARRELGASLDGELIGPADDAYDSSRSVYNAMIDRYPALIARCASENDVSAMVTFARRHDLPIAVRGGGHNGAGLGVCDDGVVIDLSPLDSVEVDGGTRKVRAGGGCTLSQVDATTYESGLAVPAGIISTTGIGGLTLGGGIGHLTRKAGLTIDNLIEARVVLADGTSVTANEDENPDLFWALRGGGGNFGVVTSFTFRAHPVSIVQAGPTFWPIEHAPEVMRWYREFLPSAGRDLNGFFAFLTIPPAPMFPEELHMRQVCGVVWCHTGDEQEAARDLSAVQTVGTPLLHGVGPAPFPAVQSLFDPIYPPGHQWYWRADFVNELSDDAIAAHEAWGSKLPTPQSTVHLYPIDGAAHDVGTADTPWAYREATWAEVIVGVDPDPENAGLVRDWTVDYWEATHPYSAGGAYVNFMMDEGHERVRATYRGNYDRLSQVKAAYDPDNVFHFNQNIEPRVPA